MARWRQSTEGEPPRGCRARSTASGRPSSSATEALNQIAIIVSKLLAGAVDLDTAHSAIAGLKAYIIGTADSTFEEKLRRYEALTQTQSAIFGDAPQANGHDTSLHNGHAVNGNGAY
jgi:hypothetical protein